MLVSGIALHWYYCPLKVKLILELLKNMLLHAWFVIGDTWTTWTWQIRLLATFCSHMSLKPYFPCLHFSTNQAMMWFCNKFSLLLTRLYPIRIPKFKINTRKRLTLAISKFCKQEKRKNQYKNESEDINEVTLHVCYVGHEPLSKEH